VGADFNVPALALGPWFRKDVRIRTDDETSIVVENVCTPFSSDINPDTKWQFVRALTIITLVVGSLATLALMVSLCWSVFSVSHWKYLAVIFALFLSLCQGLTFLLLDSNACTSNPLIEELPGDGYAADTIWTVLLTTVYKPECEWSTGSTANVLAVACWFFTGLSMLFVGAPVA